LCDLRTSFIVLDIINCPAASGRVIRKATTVDPRAVFDTPTLVFLHIARSYPHCHAYRINFLLMDNLDDKDDVYGLILKDNLMFHSES